MTSSITSLVGRNAEGYITPPGTMMGSGMNSGFYQKVSPHKILGFDFTGASINSTNRMFSIQAGKTLNFPTFLSFLGDVGIYGGVGIESSDLNIGYELENPLAYGCFSGSTYLEETSEDDCKGSKSWETGVPTNISLSFPGDNTFRSLIGARMRILFVDAYVDYNMGNSSNSLNAGFWDYL